MKLHKILFAALCLVGASAHANLIQNGSFEAPDQAAGTWNIYASLPGWTSGSAGIELRDQNAGLAQDGTQFVELDTTVNSWMEQTVATLVGQEYMLSFFYSPRIGVASTSNTISALVNGGLAGTYTGNGGAQHNWVQENIWFVASGASTTIRFQAEGTSEGLGGSLDNVSLTVPEPTSLLLTGAALGLLSLRRRAR